MKNTLKWYALYHEWNTDKFVYFNVLEYITHDATTMKKLRKYKHIDDVESFSELLRRELMYMFWGRTQWEVIITRVEGRIIVTPWIPTLEDISLDVTDDEFDWLGFYEYMEEKRYSDANGDIKIDVYSQVLFKWDEFINYVWDNVKIRKRKTDAQS